ncbi:MAG: TOBE domain-containing protein [Erysipelotrichaceae bacterium]|nr:TOBE domain-containing protein [Erysipelotrichaceae bacterium]
MEARYASDPYQIALAADKYAKAKSDYYEKEIARCQDALKGESDIIFGLRPEDIHEGDEAHMEKYGGVKFHITVSVAELLGHEYYVHTKFGGLDDLVCKIPMAHEIKIGDEMDILFDVKKAHLFDAGNEKRIA